MVFQGGEGWPQKGEGNQRSVIDVGFEVLQPKSHDGEEASVDRGLGSLDPLMEYQRTGVRLLGTPNPPWG